MMLENEIERLVVNYGQKIGVPSLKFTSPSTKGVPDRIFFNKKGEVFFIEFKSKKGKLSQNQRIMFKFFENHKLKIYSINSVLEGCEILDNYV